MGPARDPLPAILAEAQKLSGDELRAHLDRECGEHTALRSQVELALAQSEADKTITFQPHDDALSKGETLAGRFQILRLIGRGGMGEVYGAQDLELGGVVALKTVRPAHAHDETAMNRFRREIQLSRQVTHPNICRVFDVGRHTPKNGPPIMFLTMEYLNGDTLRDYIKTHGVIAPADALGYAEQIATGLDALHEKGIVHRDLKPANVMLCGTRVVIMDFGLARALEAESPAEITRAGFVVGTPGYMSPEQMNGDTPAAATDLYSFGIVLLEMITGKRLASGNLAFLRNLGLPAAWESCLGRCLDPDPDARPRTACEALSPLLAGRGQRLSYPAAPALVPDTRVGDYRVIRLIGKGGMGEVYLAEDVKLGRSVALKVLPASFVSDPARRKRFEQEAKTVSRLNHPNSASVFGFGEWSGGAFLATEYVEGQTLQARLQRGPLPWDEISNVGMQLSDVLQAAHDQGITHRDIKPQNIMLSAQGQVKLLDFGIAKLDQHESENGSTAEKLTTPGMIAGSVGYMSPEQALGKPVDARADIFSLGIVLYEMATARRPFPGATAAEVLSKILTSPPEPLARWNYETPLELERIVRKCLEKSPADRYQSAREVGIDLRSWSRGGATGSVPISRIEPAAVQRVSSRRWWLAAAASGAAAAAGLGLYKISEQKTPDSLVVLPIANHGTTEDEVLSDGLTEALIDQIAGTGALRVIARSAVFRLKKIEDPLETARKLNAGVLIVGKFAPANDMYNVSLEVVDVSTSAQRFKYAGATTAAGMQTLAAELVDQILRALGIRKRKVPGTAHVAEPEAYQNYLRGRHTLNRRLPDAYAKATELFRKAIELDPSYAAPYSGLADAYLLQDGILPPNDVCPKAKAAAMKAIALDPNLAEAHASLGRVQLLYDWAWGQAETTFQQAIRLNPSYPSAHSYYARLLTARKRSTEAEQEQKKAIALDPLSPPLFAALGMTYYYARGFNEAEKVFKKVIADQPGAIQSRAYLGLVHIASKNYPAAVEVLEQAIKLMGEDDPGIVSDLGLAFALMGNKTKASEALQRAERLAAKEYVPPCSAASLLLALGEKERALDSLEKSVDPDRSWPVIYYAVEPKLDPVRSEPRFQNLLRRTGAVMP